jgi:MFS family permease
MNEKRKYSSQSLLSSISPIIPKKIDIVLKRSIRWIIIILFININMLMMIDTGLFSSASTKIKEALKIDDKKFGLFGSCNHSGRILGTISFIFIFNLFNRKNLLVISLYIHSISIFLFTITDFIPLLFFARILNGFFSTFGFIYFPIWIDQFGIQTKKTFMMSLIQMASPLGMVLGYTMSTVLGSNRWKITLLIESISLFVFDSLIIIIPKKYFSKKLCFKQHFDGVEKIKQMKKIKIKPNINNKEKINNNKTNNNSKDNQKIEVNRPSLFSKNNQENSKIEVFSFHKKIVYVLTNKIFMLTVLYKSTNQFICCGIGFWLTDYLENILGEKNSYNRLYSYIIIIVIGPIIGMALGGFIGSLTGGYEKKQSVLAIFILQIISAIISIFVPMANNIYYFDLYLSIFNTFMASVVPVNTGLILWTMPKNMKGFGNGVSNLITTVLGKLPSPFLYGYIQYKYINYNRKIGMIFLMSFSLLGAIFLGIAVIFRYKDNYSEIEKAFEDSKKNNQKLTLGESFRKSIHNEVISSVFNNDTNTYNKDDLKYYNNENNYEENEEEELDSVYSYRTDSSKSVEMSNLN